MLMALEGRTLLSTIVVNSPTDTPVTGQTDLRQAIAQANHDGGGDTIVFSSLFDTPRTITLKGGQLELTGTTAGTTIAGPGAGLLTVSGSNASRVFLVDANVSASISGLTITGGDGGNNGYGGGLYNEGTLVLADCTVSGNSAGTSGGGLENKAALTLTECTVSGNSAGTGNAAASGGGLDNWGTATLTDCTVSGNSTGGSGGGLDSSGKATLTLTECTVSGNSANFLGGGLEIEGRATLTDCTVSGNSAGGLGGEPGGGGLSINGARATLTNTIVAGNSGADTGGGSFTSTNNLIGVDPLLAPLGDYGGATPTMPLLPGSPAIGKGITADYPGTSTPITTDQRGLKLDSPAPDIGAFQSQGFTLSLVAGSSGQTAQVGKTFKSPLAVLVRANNWVEPVDGGVIRFAAPSAGASATLSADTAVIDSGQASVTATANATSGKYSVTASASRAGSTSFALSNTEAPGGKGGTPSPIVVKVTDGLTGLRQAIAYANRHRAPETIILDPPAGGSKRHTIALTGDPLVVTDPATITIIGPGANLLTLSGGGKSRVFDIEGGSLALQAMTITGGRAVRGGGILNDDGTLSLTDVIIRRNRARVGGGLYNDGRTTLSGVVIEGNRAQVARELFNARGATLHWRRAPARGAK
jgi:hypothetical protein